MSKIIRAVNVMIENSDKITNTRSGQGFQEDAYYFLYDKKYQWSIASTPDDFILRFYKSSIGPLPSILAPSSDTITYRASEFKTREAFETFSSLYLLIKEKSIGVDQVLENIIDEGSDFL